MPDFRYVLVDLNHANPARMGLRPQGEAALDLLKHARDGALWDHFAHSPAVARLVEESGVAALHPLVRYVTFVASAPSRDVLGEIEQRAGRAVMEQVKSWGEQLLEQGQIPQASGRSSCGCSNAASGSLPNEVRARIEAADLGTIQRWADRLLGAAQLADVFEP